MTWLLLIFWINILAWTKHCSYRSWTSVHYRCLVWPGGAIAGGLHPPTVIFYLWPLCPWASSPLVKWTCDGSKANDSAEVQQWYGMETVSACLCRCKVLAKLVWHVLHTWWLTPTSVVCILCILTTLGSCCTLYSSGWSLFCQLLFSDTWLHSSFGFYNYTCISSVGV